MLYIPSIAIIILGLFYIVSKESTGEVDFGLFVAIIGLGLFGLTYYHYSQ